MNTDRTFNRLFARLRIQAMLRDIADQQGEAVMLECLTQALSVEFQYQDIKTQKRQAQVNT